LSPKISFFQDIDLETIAFFCLGNRDRSDDAVGLIIADKLAKVYPKNVFSEDLEDISTFLVDVIEKDIYEHIVIIDAVDFNAIPGSILITSDISNEIRPITTHTIPISQIKEIVKTQNKHFTLVGIQIKSVKFMGEISKEVLRASTDVVDLLS
jgi:hydrogenase maturation protease